MNEELIERPGPQKNAMFGQGGFNLNFGGSQFDDSRFFMNVPKASYDVDDLSDSEEEGYLGEPMAFNYGNQMAPKTTAPLIEEEEVKSPAPSKPAPRTQAPLITEEGQGDDLFEPNRMLQRSKAGAAGADGPEMQRLIAQAQKNYRTNKAAPMKHAFDPSTYRKDAMWNALKDERDPEIMAHLGKSAASRFFNPMPLARKRAPMPDRQPGEDDLEYEQRANDRPEKRGFGDRLASIGKGLGHLAVQLVFGLPSLLVAGGERFWQWRGKKNKESQQKKYDRYNAQLADLQAKGTLTPDVEKKLLAKRSKASWKRNDSELEETYRRNEARRHMRYATGFHWRKRLGWMTKGEKEMNADGDWRRARDEREKRKDRDEIAEHRNLRRGDREIAALEAELGEGGDPYVQNDGSDTRSQMPYDPEEDKLLPPPNKAAVGGMFGKAQANTAKPKPGRITEELEADDEPTYGSNLMLSNFMFNDGKNKKKKDAKGDHDNSDTESDEEKEDSRRGEDNLAFQMFLLSQISSMKEKAGKKAELTTEQKVAKLASLKKQQRMTGLKIGNLARSSAHVSLRQSKRGTRNSRTVERMLAQEQAEDQAPKGLGAIDEVAEDVDED